MAQNNTVNQPASLSSAGSTYALLETSSAYGTGTGIGIGNGTAANVDNRNTGQKVKDMFNSGHSSTTTTGTNGNATNSYRDYDVEYCKASSYYVKHIRLQCAKCSEREAGSSIGGVLAEIHGVGEKVGGEFNRAIDEAFGENQGVAHNAQISNAGDAEINTGHFATQTKNREGIVSEDHERRNFNS